MDQSASLTRSVAFAEYLGKQLPLLCLSQAWGRHDVCESFLVLPAASAPREKAQNHLSVLNFQVEVVAAAQRLYRGDTALVIISAIDALGRLPKEWLCANPVVGLPAEAGDSPTLDYLQTS
jgi:hypothetical protein